MGQKMRYSMKAELAKAERMHSGACIRLSVVFSQEDLRLLAGAGYELDAGGLSGFVRNSAVNSLGSIRSMRERYSINDAVWVSVGGRWFDRKGRPIGPTNAPIGNIRATKKSPSDKIRIRSPRAR